MLVKRYLQAPIAEDLAEKMVLVAGPRQVGKTTLARQVLDAVGPGVYLTWDRRQDRKQIRDAEWPGGEALVVLDELHKYRHWKRFIKGEFDAHRDRLRFLVTGSARLDVYRRGGDSLQGRYHHYRLHPLTQAEIAGPRRGFQPPEPGTELEFSRSAPSEIADALMARGGFPEPFLHDSNRHLRRWQKERLDRFFREDVRDLENVRDMSSMEIMADLLTERVGAPLSLNSLREDLEVSHKAVSHWLDILLRLYFAFSLRPYASKAVRSLGKMPKVYLWDPTLVADRGARFENLVALHLLKLVHFLEDHGGHNVDLHYLRAANGREVDFLVTHNRRPWFAVEAKLSETAVAPALRYFGSRLKIPWLYQVVLNAKRDTEQDSVRCLPASKFFSAMV
jgi:predicted AAA+ superfamily ATPase